MIILKRYVKYCTERGEIEFCDYAIEVNGIHYYHHYLVNSFYARSKMIYSGFYFKFANYTCCYNDYYHRDGGKFIIIKTKKYLVEVNLSNRSDNNSNNNKIRMEIKFTKDVEFNNDLKCFD